MPIVPPPGLGSSGGSCVCGGQKRLKSPVSNDFSGLPPLGCHLGVATSELPGCHVCLLFIQTAAREFSLTDCNYCQALAVGADGPSRNPKPDQSQQCSNPRGEP